jgi:uncharacterized membrane protein
MRELLWKYLIGPVVADAKNAEELAWQGTTAYPGYNPVNTIVYAVLALTSLYLVYSFFQRKEIEFDSRTAVYSIPFILLGGALRFLEDASAVPYPYNIALITPLVYMLVAALYIPGVYYLDREKLAAYGSLLLLPVLLFAALQMTGFKAIYFLGTIGITGILTAGYYFVLEERFTSRPLVLMAFSQFFGGTASMLASYVASQAAEGFAPKQIIAQMFYSLLGPPGILVMKFGVMGLALYVLQDIQEEPLRGIALITLYAVGLGTGFRVFLRVLAGV